MFPIGSLKGAAILIGFSDQNRPIDEIEFS
jgi:hypothetical protein